jgi:hypothetical protein
MRFERVFVWAGGAAFVLSLLFAAYAYGLVWSVAGPFSPAAGWRAVIINLTLFVVFAAHHSVFARPRVKAALATVVPEYLVRSLYVWTASVLFIAFIALWQRIDGQLYRATGVLALAPLAVQLCGAWLIVRSVRAIDPLDLAGIRHTASVDTLQITGPYHLVRHPLYLGWMLIVFGATRMTGDRLVFAAITSTYLIVAIPWEERSLERAFGDAYARYKERVRWRLVPYLY